MSTFHSLPVLDFLALNRDGDVGEVNDCRLSVLANPAGKDVFEVPQVQPAPTGKVKLTAITDAEIFALYNFLDTCLGRATPFWLPTWRADLELYADTGIGGSPSFKFVDYFSNGFQLGTGGKGRRNLAVMEPGKTTTYHDVTAANTVIPGAYESYTISPTPARVWYASKVTVNFLRLCRLEEDETDLSVPGTGVMEVLLPFREIPLEVPW